MLPISQADSRVIADCTTDNELCSIPPGIDLSKLPNGPPRPGVMPNFVDPVTHSAVVVAVGTRSLILALILLCVRLYSTIRITHVTGSDREDRNQSATPLYPKETKGHRLLILALAPEATFGRRRSRKGDVTSFGKKLGRGQR